MSNLNLTAREQELLCAVIDVMKADIDWKQVAPKANFNTPKQARDKWATVRSKITAGVGGEGDENGAATPKKKSTPTGKKRKNSSDDETPAKRGKKKATAKADEDDEEGGKQGLVKPEPEESDGELV